ncbi:MAG: ABC transporter substrate-binding protein, partial [Rhodospirillales bacterium]
MRKLMLHSALILAISGPAAFAGAPAGSETDQARRLVQTMGEQTVAAIKIDDKEARRRALVEAAQPALDFHAIGKAVLGHAGVKVPGDRERELMDGVIAFVSRQVIGEIERIKPEDAKLGDVTQKGDGEVRVRMKLSGIKDQIDAEWVVKRQVEAWRVTDVLIQGNSLVTHFGGQLAR